MGFNVGDQVLVLDEAISGIVSKIKGEIISIETEDGFLLDFQQRELLNVSSEATFHTKLFSDHNLSDILSEKEQSKSHKSVRVKPKDRTQPTMEVDLHIHQLTSNDKNMSSYEKLNLQLDTARGQLEFAIRKRIQKIVFIHGVGEGVLKQELETLFNRYDNIKYYDADYKKYGLGATEIYIMQNVRDSSDY